MTLARRARRLARAKPAHRDLDDAIAIVAIVTAMSGLATHTALQGNLIAGIAVALGMIVAGFELGKRSSSPDRIYLEGFADGLTALEIEPDPDAALPRPDDRGPGAGQLSELRAGARLADDPAAHRRGGPRRRAHGAGAGGDDDLVDATGARLEPRPARPRLGPDGGPLTGIGGPSFAPVPDFDPAGAVGALGRQ